MVKRTERGWAGHFCGAHDCYFRRNTLLEFGRKRIIVSTVGNYHPRGLKGSRAKTIGLNRYYETMVFKAVFEKPYWETDVRHEVPFDSPWAIASLDDESDKRADAMHEMVVAEITKSMRRK